MVAFAPTRKTPSPGIDIPEEWSVAANTIAKSFTRSLPPVVFICGAKNSGKTTFSRYLFHTFLPRYKSVAYLDTDVGQPEFTPPGCISLTIIDEATPDVSSKRDPETYLNCIFALYDRYRKDLRISCKNGSPGAAELPLIINTPGWVKGIVRGIDSLKKVIYLITPVPQNILAGVDLLLQGYIQIPIGLLQVQGCMSPYMSANVIPTKEQTS